VTKIPEKWQQIVKTCISFRNYSYDSSWREDQVVHC